MMNKCVLCPKKCGAYRNGGQKGVCGAADEIFVASCNIHTGEEPPISASRGSGAVFFSNCVLKCVFCQNYPISQLGNGRRISLEELVKVMFDFQEKGAHNVNFVTPTHYSAQMAEAVYTARVRGLTLPVIYNCGGYEEIETLKLLEGIVDIYLPDIKYSDNETAFKYSGVKNYVELNRAALKEMKRQVGSLEVDGGGVARRGIIIRHLVLPGNIENTKKALKFIAEELSEDIFISLMAQYHAAYKSDNFKELACSLPEEEYREALDYLEALNLKNGWIQTMQ